VGVEFEGRGFLLAARQDQRRQGKDRADLQNILHNVTNIVKNT
jgi:hypothetical protein